MSMTYQRLKDRVQVVEGLYDAFYGMREFIIRDCKGFWITFGNPFKRSRSPAAGPARVVEGNQRSQVLKRHLAYPVRI